MDKAFQFEETLRQGNKIIDTHFAPWAAKQGAEYVDVSGSELDRKYGIDGIIVNLKNGKARTVQVKKDSRMGETGNIYFEVSKINGAANKDVKAHLLYYIDPTTNTMYQMLLSEVQSQWDEIIEGVQLKAVASKKANGQQWVKGGYAVPLSKVKDLVKSFKEIQL